MQRFRARWSRMPDHGHSPCRRQSAIQGQRQHPPAWTRLAGPAAVRDSARALPVARRAAGLVPQNADYRAALALAQHRLGQHSEAQLQVELVKKGKAEADALAWCVLALVAAQQGDAKEARAALERARAWEQARGKTLAAHRKAALQALRKEAEAALAALAPDS